MVEETKQLNDMVRSDLSCSSNTDYIVSRCNNKLWVLRRLTKLRANHEDLKDIFIKQIRSVLEFTFPVLNSSLTATSTLVTSTIPLLVHWNTCSWKTFSVGDKTYARSLAENASRIANSDIGSSLTWNRPHQRYIQPRFAKFHCRLEWLEKRTFT